MTLPARAASDVYLRVPEGAALALDVAAAGVRLRIVAETDGAAPAEIAAVDPSPAGAWRALEAPLAALGGQAVRLRFVVEPVGPDPAASARVRRAVLVVPSPEAERRPPRPSRPNVILYVIDTVRADHLGCYGSPRSTTPRLDGFATQAVLFTQAMAQSSWTLPSTASLLTGRTPPHHGAEEPEDGIDPRVPTLAAVLSGAGWETAAFVTNYLGSAAYGHARGFGTFRFYAERGDTRAEVYLPARVLQRRVARWLARRGRGPFFLYVHASDPHFPYRPPARDARPLLPPGVRYADALATADRLRGFYLGNAKWGIRPNPIPSAEVAILRDLYDGDLHAADAAFGALLDALAGARLLNDTLIVVTSDHGEEFLEHGGVEHGQTLHREVLHVPLLVRLPEGREGGRRSDALAQHIDVMPTILEAVGVSAPSDLDGRSLFGQAPDGEVYAALRLAGRTQDALVTPAFKVIGADGRWSVYDPRHDPGEERDLAAASPVRLRWARRRVAAHRVRQATPAPVDPDTLDRLRALGYVVD